MLQEALIAWQVQLSWGLRHRDCPKSIKPRGHPDFSTRWRLRLQMIRNRSDRYALVAVEQQQGPDRLGSIVVQQVMPPMALDQFGNQHCDIAVRMKNLLLDCVLDDRFHNKSIRRIEYYQLRQRQSGRKRRFLYHFTPLAAQALCFAANAASFTAAYMRGRCSRQLLLWSRGKWSLATASLMPTSEIL